MQKIVVTQYPAMVDYLIEQGLVPSDVPVLSHAKPRDIRGKHVFGVLPLRLACHAAKVTETPLTLSAAQRYRDLSLQEIRDCALPLRTYYVRVEYPATTED